MKTYCNPLPIPQIPRGTDEWFSLQPGMFNPTPKPAGVTGPDYRSISDPTVFYENGKWYLYPSYGMAWVSEDFCTWTHVPTDPYCPKYSPAIIRWNDSYLMTAWKCPLYRADSPLGPFRLMGNFRMPDGTEFVPCDPALFADDDGRLYLYAFDADEDERGNVVCCRIIGYELDRDDPRTVVRGPATILTMDPHRHPWERQGYHQQNVNFGWIEAPHLLKVDGRYYMLYAAPDTCDAAYCMAVYYSDESPLSGFVCQKNNPLTANRHGIVGGAGHGSVEVGPDGTLWAFYTIAAPCLHRYERRIGMDRVIVDEDGELVAPDGVTDTPQFAPGSGKTGPCGLVSLTGKLRPTVSSRQPGREAIYATDESNLTWWEPDPADPAPTLQCDLQASFTVSAVRVWWRDGGLDYDRGIVPGPIGYRLEGETDAGFVVLLDRQDATQEYNIDYQTFTPCACRQVRLVITGKPQGINPGVIDFAVFGGCEEE